jgi:hypothetical protein
VVRDGNRANPGGPLASLNVAQSGSGLTKGLFMTRARAPAAAHPSTSTSSRSKTSRLPAS